MEARTWEDERTEVRLKAKTVNQMTRLGMPKTCTENMQNGFLNERSRKSLPCVRQQSSFNKALFNWHFFLSDASTPWIFAPPAVARLVVAESTFRPSLRPRASSNSPTEIRAGSRRWDKQSQLHLPELFLQLLEAGGLQELGVGRASRGFFARWILVVDPLRVGG